MKEMVFVLSYSVHSKQAKYLCNIFIVFISKYSMTISLFSVSGRDVTALDKQHSVLSGWLFFYESNNSNPSYSANKKL